MWNSTPSQSDTKLKLRSHRAKSEEKAKIPFIFVIFSMFFFVFAWCQPVLKGYFILDRKRKWRRSRWANRNCYCVFTLGKRQRWKKKYFWFCCVQTEQNRMLNRKFSLIFAAYSLIFFAFVQCERGLTLVVYSALLWTRFCALVAVISLGSAWTFARFVLDRSRWALVAFVS